MSAVPGGQDRPGRDEPAGVVPEARGAAEANSEPPIVTLFAQLRSGEIHEFGTVDSDAGDTAQDVMDALAGLLRECADHLPVVIVDRDLGPDAARWSPREQERQDEP